jgi:hypothetical protein
MTCNSVSASAQADLNFKILLHLPARLGLGLVVAAAYTDYSAGPSVVLYFVDS